MLFIYALVLDKRPHMCKFYKADIRFLYCYFDKVYKAVKIYAYFRTYNIKLR